MRSAELDGRPENSYRSLCSSCLKQGLKLRAEMKGHHARLRRRAFKMRPVHVLVSLLIVAAAGQPVGNANDTELLLEFKASFENGETALADWDPSASGGCSWPGISCNAEGQVTEM